MSSDKALIDIRKQLIDLNVDAFIITSSDAHQSEYVHDSEMRRSFVSNFTGSAGTALVLNDKALLWTDGRYFLQASQELSSSWLLMKSGEPGVLEINDWLLDNLKPGQVVGVDAYLFPSSNAIALEKLLSSKGIVLKGVEYNPVDKIWNNRPLGPNGIVNIHNIDLAGESHLSKISKIQSQLISWGASSIVISMLDEIMWLFNIRGSDISYNPVAICYAVLTTTKAYLFIDLAKITEQVKSHLGEIVNILPYESIDKFLVTQVNEGPVVCDPLQLNWQLYTTIKSNIVEKTSPITLAKSKKNQLELNGIREAHIRDGAALTAFLNWLTITVKSGTKLSECDVVDKLEEFRGRMDKHVGPSFSTISGYGANGAIIHYKPEKDTCATLGTDSLFLLDSGAQYLDGTTDVTRTLCFGTPNQHMKDCFTLVLKGHIALAKAIFPEGTLGTRLDCLARTPLWAAGLDFNHGTGHGVGAYLNVHEGPQGITFRKKDNEIGFYEGMTTSNEPGYYEEGNFGIRIENVCIVVPAKTSHQFNGRKFLTLEDVTMTPITKHLMNLDLLDDDEKAWINAYHAKVRENVSPLMQKYFPEAMDYLISETIAI